MTDNNKYFDILLEFIKRHDIFDLSDSNLLTDAISDDYNIILNLVKHNCNAMHCASDRLKGNKEIVLAAICNYDSDYFSVLDLASDELRGDKEVVLAAVRSHGKALEYASIELRADREIVLAAVQQNGYALQYASPELKNNKEVVLAAVRQNSYALKYASDELRGDKEVVLAAVHKNGLALEFASDRLRGDKEVVLAAVQQNGIALQLASNELKNNLEVVLAAVQQYGIALQLASNELKNNLEVVLAAVQQNGLVYYKIPNKFKNNKKVTYATVQQNGLVLIGIINHLYNLNIRLHDKKLVSIAVQQNIEALNYLSFLPKKIKNDKKFLIECYRNNKNSIQFNEFIKEFDNLENEIYNNNIFMKENADILNLVNNNREQLYNYLFKNNKYDIIYENDEIAEYIKDNHKIVIFSLNHIEPISNHDIEEVTEVTEVTEVVTEEKIKQTYSNTLLKMDPKLTPIFID